MAARYYPAILEKSSTGFGVHFPDLDGCTSSGETMEQAAANAEEALALHLSGMRKDGDRIPEPTPLDEVRADPDVTEAARILVRADLPAGRCAST